MSSASRQDPSKLPQPDKPWPDSISPFARSVIAAAADIALLIDADGTIAFVAGSDDTAPGGHDAWVGKAFVDIVSPDSRAKARDLVARAGPAPARAFSEINHPSDDGAGRAFRYGAVREAADGGLFLVGRDLRPLAALQQRLVESQQAMEREYARLRLAETRYRMMFHLSSEPILVVDAASLRLVEANPAALHELAIAMDRLTRTTLPSLLSPASGDALQAMLGSARASGEGEEIEVGLSAGNRRARISATAFRQDGAVNLLVRLRLRDMDKDTVPGDHPLRHVQGMLEQTPDGCVIMGPDRLVLHANRAFLELAQLASKHQVVGQPLDRWLGRPGIDLPLIQEKLADHGVIRNFPTIIRGEFGGTEEVELSAVTAWAGDAGSTGLIIRSKGVQAIMQPQRGKALPRSVEQLAQLVGRVPLKEIVRETSDVIEKLCIESALDLSRGNRAAAAQMLGLSRQSFYAKLRRHGLGDRDEADEAL